MAAPYLSDSWKSWVAENTRRGVSRLTIYETMRNKGFGLGAIRLGMGATFPLDVATDSDGRDSSGRSRRYKDIANCAITTRKSPGLRKVITSKAQLYVWDGFLEPETCDHLSALINSSLRASTITTPMDSDGYDPTFRTSETCYLDELNDPAAKELEARICSGLGIAAGWSEPNQAQKYSVGQEFKAHTDYFEPGSDEYASFCNELGQRTWTVMVYLNEGCEGGATRFRRLDKMFHPKKGAAVFWNSMSDTGDPNPDTIHHGMKVREGEKFVITKWFRDKGTGPLFG